ncbi:MAG: hypothetical protein ACR2FS_13460 [Phormidesmis sp.]
MSERLDRIESGIETLMAACSTNLVAIRETAGTVDKLVVKIDESNQRFDIQRGEAQADRQETRQLWSDAVTQMNADRAESARRFDAAQETIQRLLLAIVDLSRDNNRLRDRVDGLEQRAS